jgi:hypothetical protein
MPPQPEYADFISRFFRILFAPDDVVVLSRLTPSENGPMLSNKPYSREYAILALLNLHLDTPNIYFQASAHDGTDAYGKSNCVRTQAFYLDLDYGAAGHSGKNAFRSLDDAVGYLLTMPLRPSCAWHTGHGVQACYLLDKPYQFLPGGGDALSLARYEAVSSKLSKMSMSDDTFTAEHLFRVPLSINDKRWKDKALIPVRGELLWCDEDRRYAFEALEELVDGYGIDEHIKKERKESEADPAVDWGDGDTDDLDAPYDALPEGIREWIEGEQIVDGEKNRSKGMFAAIGRLIRDRYNDRTIHEAIGRGQEYQDKYGDRMDNEVDRCIAKVREGRYVYTGGMAPSLKVYNVPEEVHLNECDALDPELDAMLSRYAEVNGIELAERVRKASRFHEHMFNTRDAGVLETLCGSGKSTWAFCHISLRANAENRYIYVTETVEALYTAADVIQRLTDTPVGRVHGFNEDRCFGLCGTRHSWRVCYPKDPKSVCHTCEKRGECCFYNRMKEQEKPILCMTHAGLIRAIEDTSGLLQDASILIDESLNPFNTWEVHVSELRHLQKHVPAAAPIDAFFPYSRHACRGELEIMQIPEAADTFARRNYVFRNEAHTAALRGAHDALRKCMGARMASPDPFRAVSGDEQKARDTLCDLLNFFRPGELDDASYAYREINDDRGVRFAVKRSRFQLDVPRGHRKLWMLNASAQLCPYQYPDNMAVHSCPDIPDSSHLVTLHVVRGNPTKSRQAQNVWLSHVALWLGHTLRRIQHMKVLVATDKNSEVLDSVMDQFHSVHGPNVEVVHLSRGRIKGLNTAGECTLAYITSMATFTTIDDCALHAALLTRRTYPDRPYVYASDGEPNWPGGRFRIPAMRQYYSLRSLDEIYQTIWRTAVRNDRPVEAIIAVPDPDWIVALWRTVMPHFNLGLAYRQNEEEGTIEAGGQSIKYEWEFSADPGIGGLRIVCSPPGTEFGKRQIADEFGYTGEQAWKRNKQRIIRLLSPFFEAGSTNRRLRRKGAGP